MNKICGFPIVISDRDFPETDGLIEFISFGPPLITRAEIDRRLADAEHEAVFKRRDGEFDRPEDMPKEPRSPNP